MAWKQSTRLPLTYLVREDLFIIQKPLSPVHQGIDVFGGWKLGRSFESNTIFPQVLVSVAEDATIECEEIGGGASTGSPRTG